MARVKVAVGYIIEESVMNDLLIDIKQEWITPVDKEVSGSEGGEGITPDDEEFSGSEGGEVITVNPVVRMVNMWARRLTDDERAQTPRILHYLPDALSDNGSCSFFVLTRWAYIKTAGEVDQKLSECESDINARQKFMTVFGRGIQESHMTFNTRIYKTLDNFGA